MCKHLSRALPTLHGRAGVYTKVRYCTDTYLASGNSPHKMLFFDVEFLCPCGTLNPYLPSSESGISVIEASFDDYTPGLGSEPQMCFHSFPAVVGRARAVASFRDNGAVLAVDSSRFSYALFFLGSPLYTFVVW